MKLDTFPVKWPRKILISKVSACSQVDQPANPDLKKADCNRSYNVSSYPTDDISSERESENRKKKVSKKLLPSNSFPFSPLIHSLYTEVVNSKNMKISTNNKIKMKLASFKGSKTSASPTNTLYNCLRKGLTL